MADVVALRDLHTLSHIKEYHDGMDDDEYEETSDINTKHAFLQAEKVASLNPLLVRKLVEVFNVEVFNHSKEDLEIYGTVEFTAREYFSRSIYNREKDDSVLIKGNGSAYLLLNGPKSVFGLDYFDLSFAASLRDKRDDRLIYVGSGNHPRHCSLEIRTIHFYESLSYASDSKDSLPVDEDEEMQRPTPSLALVLTYVVYHEAVVASLNFYYHGHQSSTVYGYITAESNMFPYQKSFLFLKKQSKALLLSPGQEIVLSKQLVAVPCTGRLFVDVKLPGIAEFETEFDAKPQQDLEETIDFFPIKVHVTWNPRSSNLIEAIEEVNVTRSLPSNAVEYLPPIPKKKREEV